MKTKEKTAKKETIKIVDISIRKDRPAGENPFENITATELATFVGIKDAPVLLGIAYTIYARRLLKEGRIEGVKVQYKHYQKWLISPESITYYNSHKATRTGMRRFLLRTSAENEDAVRDALGALGIEFTLELTYKAKKVS